MRADSHLLSFASMSKLIAWSSEPKIKLSLIVDFSTTEAQHLNWDFLNLK